MCFFLLPKLYFINKCKFPLLHDEWSSNKKTSILDTKVLNSSNVSNYWLVLLILLSFPYLLNEDESTHDVHNIFSPKWSLKHIDNIWRLKSTRVNTFNEYNPTYSRLAETYYTKLADEITKFTSSRASKRQGNEKKEKFGERK